MTFPNIYPKNDAHNGGTLFLYHRRCHLATFVEQILMTKKSSSTPREYELVNANSSEIGHFQSQQHDDDDDEDGVWRVTDRHHVAAGVRVRPVSKRRLASLFCILVVVIIVFLSFCSRNNENEDNSSTTPDDTVSSNQEQASATAASDSPTVSPTATTRSSSPTASPTAPPKESTKKEYNCKGDRIQNGVQLETNHYICDHYLRYRFGMNESGSLIYADDALHTTVNLYNGTKGDYFELLVDGNFTVYNTNNGDVVWQQECSDDVTFSPECLPTNHDTYDCPYLHLHSGGTIVLNWISASSGEWKERNILHMYDLNRNCKDHFVCQP